ncbi:tetratricopeptide repeat protein [Mariniblastus fucicola]|uniref:tetratricopeptide repeat protein n=1 Tax=Mariniblastus fucicola TaxID=980251 RepID=UPI00143DB1B8|nr:tetratricopeptide repeat protein [Mariniblastus fucicola]
MAAFAINCDDCGWSLNTSVDEPAISSQGATTATAVKGTKTAASQGAKAPRSSREADAHLEKAMQRIEKESYEAAVRSINRAIVAAPLNRIGECYSLRGYCHLKLDDFVRSEKDCTEAIRQSWNDAQTFAWRAAARGEQNRWRHAFSDLEKAWHLSDDDRDRFTGLMDSYSDACEAWFEKQEPTPATLSEMGWVHYCRSRYRKAEDCFEKAIEMDADYALAAAGLAKLIFENKSSTGRYRSDRAREVLQHCAVAMTGDSECHQVVLPIRIKIHRSKADLDRAMEDLNHLSALAKDDSELAVRCCRLRFEAGDYMVAIQELSKMLKSDPPPADALLLRGDCYREIRNHSLAIVDYSRFLKLRRNDTDALARLAESKLAIGKVDEALSEVEHAIDIDEACFSAYICRSKIKLQQGKLDEAITDCRKASLIDNSQPQVFATLASINFKLGRYTESIEEYSRAIELEEDVRLKANLLYLRGIALYELGRYQASYADFKKACHYRPNHAGSWIWKSAACARLEKWTDAIAGLQSAIATRPSSQDEYRKLGAPVATKAIEFFDRQQQRGQATPDLFRRRALALQFLGEFDKAIEDYTNALRLDADNVETLIRRGQTLYSVGKNDEAIKDFKSAIRRDRGNDQALFQLANTRFDMGQYATALRDVKLAIESSPRNVRYYGLYADVLQKLGQHEGVIEALDRATLLDSTDPVTYQKRGQVHMLRRNYVNAISDFTRSLELSPNQPEVTLARGQAYLKADQPQQAIEDFERVLTQNLGMAKAYSGRAAAMATLGRHEYALIWLTKAFHRFQRPRDLSELVFARGKIFVLMGRPAPAIDDFTTVARLMEEDDKTVAAARYARAIARYGLDQPEKAKRDFAKVFKLDPRNEHAALALQWLNDPESCDKPKLLEPATEIVRPTRPGVVRSAVTLTTPPKDWTAEKPYHTWILRTLDKKEYGPMSRETLNLWIEEGRVDFGMKLLRADWSKWKRAEKIFNELGVSSEPPESDENVDVRPE